MIFGARIQAFSFQQIVQPRADNPAPNKPKFLIFTRYSHLRLSVKMEAVEDLFGNTGLSSPHLDKRRLSKHNRGVFESPTDSNIKLYAISDGIEQLIVFRPLTINPYKSK